MPYLWRAVDQEGEVLETYVTKTREKAAALSFMKKALERRAIGPPLVAAESLSTYRPSRCATLAGAVHNVENQLLTLPR